MSTAPFQWGAAGIDLSGRMVYSKTVAASPSGSAETTICTLTIPGGLALASGVLLGGWAAYTVGTSGVSVNLKIRQTSTSGSTIVATGAATKTAGSLYADDVNGVDTSPPAAGVYVLTMTVASGAATSTVSAVILFAIVI